jgi:diphosphomevalonate decarboxylase
LSIEPKLSTSDDIELRFYFENKENLAFRLKILKFFESIHKEFSFLRDYSIVVQSMNSFPHSSGIASSASAMSALALCLCSIDDMLNKRKTPKKDFFERASHFARLGSGSACRSIYPLMASWGEFKQIKNSSDKFATDCSDWIHPVFKTFQNSILIASAAEKKVSSRVGHSLMDKNPFAKARYKQANVNLSKLIKAMAEGDLETFGDITESEALTLHALMMCSTPSYTLMTPNTLAMIERIRAFREDTKLPLYFTLDAGPNIHLLYPKKIAEKVRTFIDLELVELCENGKVIFDQVGKGPILIK